MGTPDPAIRNRDVRHPDVQNPDVRNPDVRDRIESGLSRWGHVVCRHARLTIALSLACVGALATWLPGLRVDPSMEVFLHESDPIRTTYDQFREDFGRDDQILVAFRVADAFDPGFLRQLEAFHAAVEDEVPRVNDVTSLVNARSTLGRDDELVVEDLLEDWPETPEALAAVRARALANPVYRNLLLTEDATLTTVLIELDAFVSDGAEDDALAGFDDDAGGAPAQRRRATGDEDLAAVAALERISDRFRAEGLEIYTAGAPAMNGHLQVLMRRDMGRFTGLAVLSIAVFLGFLFRRVGAVVLPLLVVALSIVCTLSVMAATDTPIAGPTQILPSFLLAVGVGGSVHLLAIFFQRRRRGESTEDSVAFALGHSGLAIAMTSFTTAGGLSSFAAAELAPVAHFGTFGPLGVIFALVLTLVLLPALLAVVPMRPFEPRAGRQVSQRVLARTGDWATANARTVLAVTAALLVFAGVGASRIYFSFSPLDWFAEGDPFLISNELIDRDMEGSMFLEALVDTGRENGLHEPETLARLAEIHAYLEAVEVGPMHVGKAVSLVDVVYEIHQALNENRPEFRVVPDTRELVAQELLLFENSGSEDLADFTDPLFRVGRVTLKAPFVDAAAYGPFIAELESGMQQRLGDAGSVTLTGIMALMGRTIAAAVETMVRSYLVAFVVITPLMVLLIGRLGMGLLSMVPNLTPIVLTLGLMGWTGIPLNPFTLLIGSIALGLAVDDTIHFMHNFRRYFARSGDVRAAVHETLVSTGQALLFTTLVLSTGFFLYTFASLHNLFHFGLLTGFTVIVAFLADMVLAPALMSVVYGRKRDAAV